MDPITAGLATKSGVEGAVLLVNQVKNALNNANAFSGNKSLIDVSSAARVEPLLLIDADVINLEYLPDVVQTMQSLFSGYYLQAIEILSSIDHVSLAQKLGPLNPNRNPAMLSHEDWRMSQEAYAHRLPTRQNTGAVALEAAKVNATLDKDALKTMHEVANLSVGKLYNVTLREGDKSASLKVAIRVMANSLPTQVLINLFSFKNQFDMDLKERYHGWRAGRLAFVKDLILCQDLIEKHRTALIKDKSGIYNEIINRQNRGIAAGLIDKNPSLAIASNLAIISNDTAEQIEQKVMGRFSNYKTRQMIFDTTNLMILAVVDKGFERITFYHRGIQQYSDMSLRDIKSANKGNGSEVMDIMKAFISGNSPHL